MKAGLDNCFENPYLTRERKISYFVHNIHGRDIGVFNLKLDLLQS